MERSSVARAVAEDTTFASTGTNQVGPNQAATTGGPQISADNRTGGRFKSNDAGLGKTPSRGLHPVLMLAGGLLIAWLVVRSK